LQCTRSVRLAWENDSWVVRKQGSVLGLLPDGVSLSTTEESPGLHTLHCIGTRLVTEMKVFTHRHTPLDWISPNHAQMRLGGVWCAPFHEQLRSLQIVCDQDRFWIQLCTALADAPVLETLMVDTSLSSLRSGRHVRLRLPRLRHLGLDHVGVARRPHPITWPYHVFQGLAHLSNVVVPRCMSTTEFPETVLRQWSSCCST
jgi:hypothetical protein